MVGERHNEGAGSVPRTPPVVIPLDSREVPMPSQEEFDELKGRLESLEKQIAGAAPQEFTEEELAAFRKVSAAANFGEFCGINDCFRCRVCAVCRVCQVCRVCKVCDFECSCGPCNVGGIIGGIGGFNQFGG